MFLCFLYVCVNAGVSVCAFVCVRACMYACMCTYYRVCVTACVFHMRMCQVEMFENTRNPTNCALVIMEQDESKKLRLIQDAGILAGAFDSHNDFLRDSLTCRDDDSSGRPDLL